MIGVSTSAVAETVQDFTKTVINRVPYNVEVCTNQTSMVKLLNIMRIDLIKNLYNLTKLYVIGIIAFLQMRMGQYLLMVII